MTGDCGEESCFLVVTQFTLPDADTYFLYYGTTCLIINLVSSTPSSSNLVSSSMSYGCSITDYLLLFVSIYMYINN